MEKREGEEPPYEALFQSAPDGLVLTDGEDAIREVNRAASRLLRGVPESLRGNPLARFVTAAEQARFAAYCLRLRFGREARRGGWTVMLQPLEGLPFPAALTASPFGNSLGGGRAWIWALRDITRQQRAVAERELLLQELQLTRPSVLSRLVPLCAACQRVRDDAGTWNELTTYLTSHFDLQLTRGLCPGCRHRLSPDIVKG